MIELMHHHDKLLLRGCNDRPAVKLISEKLYFQRNSSNENENEDSSYFVSHTIPKTSVHTDSNGNTVATTIVQTLNPSKIHTVFKQHEDDESESPKNRKKYHKNVLNSHSINNTETEMSINATDAVADQDVNAIFKKKFRNIYQTFQKIANKEKTMIIEAEPYQSIPSCVGVDVMEVLKTGLSQNEMYKNQNESGKKKMIAELWSQSLKYVMNEVKKDNDTYNSKNNGERKSNNGDKHKKKHKNFKRNKNKN